MTTTTYHNGTETSRAAAEAIEPHAVSLRDRVLAFVVTRGFLGATCDEVEDGLGLSHQTTSARLRDLATMARIYHHGQRNTRSGRKARIYYARVQP